MSNNISVNGSPRSSHLSPTASTSSIPAWAPPKTPLAPHRLAKLANALGVSTPMPATHHAPMMSPLYPQSPSFLNDGFRRSPTPSSSSNHNLNVNSYAPSTSKFLLHVIPPLHLPHDTDTDDFPDMTPPPATASGYHTQFRRGIFVPVHPTLQAQLGAIAKEYALPSISGLILYLVTSAPRSPQSGNILGRDEDEEDEPGPRLSEDIWKHLWTRVLKAEQRDELVPPLPTRSLTPNTFNFLAGRSTPHLIQDANGYPLRPLVSTNNGEALTSQTVAYPSPSTPSSSAPPSSSVTHSEPETPGTSIAESERENSLDLPGLNSPSLIPILAKVEFDIDRRKAGWYEPWLRSRKMNHAKRVESRKASYAESMTDGSDSVDSDRRAPLTLKLSERVQTASPLSMFAHEEEKKEYQPLPDSPLGDSGSESDDEKETAEEEEEEEEDDNEDDATARVASFPQRIDPLDDVFGTDADTWAGMRGSRGSKRQTNSNVVDLALTAAELSALPDPGEEMEEDEEDLNEGGLKDEDEVKLLLESVSRPPLTVSIPGSPSGFGGLALNRKNVPPPLVLQQSTSAVELSAPSPDVTTPSSGLPYLRGTSSEDLAGREPVEYEDYHEDDHDYEEDYRSPESDKRGGGVFDDLDLGLDPTLEFEDDPDDRRQSQYLLKAQLDQIEKNLLQFSPRVLQVDLEEEQDRSMSSLSLSPRSAKLGVPSPLGPGVARNADVFPPTPRSRSQFDLGDESDSIPTARSWPAVPFSSLAGGSDLPSSDRPSGPNAPPSPPRLAVNGVTTSAPRSFNPSASTGEMSAETVTRRKEAQEEEQFLYPPMTPAVGRKTGSPPGDSPVIPLSPDPFGRYPSTPDIPGDSRSSSVYWDSVQAPQSLESVLNQRQSPPRGSSDTKSSRFSADSANGSDAVAKPSNRSTVMSVKSIKKLWRKSNGKSISGSIPGVPASSRPSQEFPQTRSDRSGSISTVSTSIASVSALPVTPTFGAFPKSKTPPPRPERPSQEEMEIPDIPDTHTLNVPQFMGRSQNSSPIVVSNMQQYARRNTYDRLHFDQESPYPIRRTSPAPSPPTRYVTQPPSPPMMPPPEPAPSTPPLSQMPESQKNSVRKSILKWKNSAAASLSSSSQSPSPLQSNFAPSAQTPVRESERPQSNSTVRSRRPSVLNFGSARSSTVSTSPPPPDIPPSPQIPEQYLSGRSSSNAGEWKSAQRSHLVTPSMDSSQYSAAQRKSSLNGRSPSPAYSMTSSRLSEETRPSFDSSQFEMVSPKVGTLAYPYHQLDHE